MISPRLCVLGALSVALWSGTPSAQVSPCSERWTYHPPSGYWSPPLAADSAGTLVWREGSNRTELVAVRGGKARWRRRTTQRVTGFPFNAMVFGDALLVQAFGSRVEAYKISNGATVWTRDLKVDHRQVRISTLARLGRLIVVAAAASDTLGWLTAIKRDGRIAWQAHIPGAVARLAAYAGQLNLLMSVTRAGEPPPSTVDTTGKPVGSLLLPRTMFRAVSGDEVVFDSGYAVAAEVASEPVKCPPQSPSCHPAPEMLTVAGFSADGASDRWHYTVPPTGLHVQLLLLNDSSVLLVDSAGVARVTAIGTSTRVCGLPLSGHWSVAGLFRGDLVIAGREGLVAYEVPGGPRLAASGWVMRGGGPAQDWAAR